MGSHTLYRRLLYLADCSRIALPRWLLTDCLTPLTAHGSLYLADCSRIVLPRWLLTDCFPSLIAHGHTTDLSVILTPNPNSGFVRILKVYRWIMSWMIKYQNNLPAFVKLISEFRYYLLLSPLFRYWMRRFFLLVPTWGSLCIVRSRL